ncbi:MAG TPA: UDP-N-acetylmuramoyl-tripeptide--D-alanyl-D-alanine ligase [Longimicrobiales bacterium]|nr:UDP-N-acetylmuramoyl-tripeptide--D-alanyl-D-alanine ligase [Longimicrobiales bacterium]
MSADTHFVMWTEATVTAVLGIGARAGDHEVSYTGVGTDTRALKDGELFVALRGERFDAHDFLQQAHECGATGAVVERVPEGAPAGMRYYEVPDTLAALALLGRARRHAVGARVCAVAGSNGKTTTKELLRAALSPRYRVHATTGNLNNLIGAPLTLLATPDTAEVIVAEIGTNTPGEVARLAAIVEPDAAVITGISAEHLEGLGDLEGVLREETSVVPWVPRAGVIVVADDPAVLPERARRMHPAVQVAGLTEQADAELRGADVALDEEGRVSFAWAGRRVQLELRGRHNARNALVALGVARAWGVPDDQAIAALEELEPPKMRAEFHRFRELTVIADCYNSNPASVHAAVDLLTSMPKRGGRVAVLGSMLELGPRSGEIHREVADDVARQDIDVIVATGEFADAFGPHRAALGSRLIITDEALDAWQSLAERLRGTETVLLKGSRGVALERLLPRFMEQWGSLHPHGEASGSRAIDSNTGTRDDARPAEHPQTSTAARGGGEKDGPGTGEGRGN